MYFFLFLCCLFAVCAIIGIGAGLLKRYHAWKGRQDLLQRDLRVKDDVIREQRLEIALLTAHNNLLRCALEKKKRAGIVFSRPQAG